MSTEADSGGDSTAESGDDSGACPECDADVSAQGVHGHLRFKHGYTSDEANRILDDSEGGEGEGGRQPYPQNGHVSDAPRDEIDDVLNDILRRYDQRAKVALVRDLADEDRDNGEDLLDRLEQLKQLQELFESDSDDGITRQELLKVIETVKESGGRQPSRDAGDGLLETAIAHGQTDPETLEHIASVSPAEKKYEFYHDLLDRVDGEALGQAVSSILAAFSGARQQHQVSTDAGGGESTDAGGGESVPFGGERKKPEGSALAKANSADAEDGDDDE